MIIDTHTHVQRVPGSFWDSPPERLIRLMDEANVEKSVIMSYGGAPPEISVDYIDECVKNWPERMIGYANLDPRDEQKVSSLLHYAVKNLGFKGLKLHPVAYELHPVNPLSIKILKKAAELCVPVLFHCGDEEYTLPLQIAMASALCPETIMILGHMGGYFHVKDAINVAETYRNIILETSAMPYPYMVKEAVKRIGSERILFASDGPGCTPELDIIKVRRAGLSEDEEKDLFYRNIERLHSGSFAV